jgi:hypothetical protein
MGDSLLLAYGSLELVSCQQATHMLLTLVTHELTAAVSLHTALAGLLQCLYNQKKHLRIQATNVYVALQNTVNRAAPN